MLKPSILRGRIRRFCFALLAGASLLTLAACVSIPDDPDALKQRDMTRARLAENIKLARDQWPDTQWWKRYEDPQLTRLIEQALKDGPSLQVAAAHIGTARAALQRDTSEKGINVGLNATTSRTLYSADGFFPPPIGGAYYTETTVEAAARYDFDWWGKHKSAIAASLGEVNARQAEFAQAERTLSTAVAERYFALQGANARLSNMQELLSIQRDSLADSQRRVDHGVANNNSAHIAEFGLATLSKQMAQLETQISLEREALRALLGADAQALTDLTPVSLPQAPSALPSRLGIELLARRPDLQAARWRIEASLNRIEATQAAFYPDINLTAFFGSDVLSLNQLFNTAARTMAIAPVLTLPLFDSGRLKAALAAARGQRNEMIADYNQSVVHAVEEVAQNGAAVQGLQNQYAQQIASETATNAILRSTKERYDHGLAGRNALLTAELIVREQQDVNIQLKTQLLLADVDLIKALGGGYVATENGSGASAPIKMATKK